MVKLLSPSTQHVGDFQHDDSCAEASTKCRSSDDHDPLNRLSDFPRLFQGLRKALIQYDNHMSSCSFSDDSTSLRLPLCVLSAGLEIATGSPVHLLRLEIQDCYEDIVYCVPKLVETVLSWKGDDAIRESAITSAILVLSRVAVFVPNFVATFGVSLLHGFRENVPASIQLDVACTLIGLLRSTNDPEQRLIMLQQIDAHHGIIIPVLSTAVTSGEQNQVFNALDAFVLLSQSPAIRRKLSRRRGVVLALAKQLENTDSRIQRTTVSLCKMYFDAKHRDHSNLLEKNSVIVTRALCQLIENAADTAVLMEALNVAMVAIRASTLDSSSKDSVASSMLHIARCSKSDVVATEATLAYIQSASKAESRPCVLKNALEFLGSSDQKIRHEVLLLLKDISYWNPRTLMLDSLGFLDKLAVVLLTSSGEDCAEAMQICRQLSSEDGIPPLLCMNKSLVSVIVNLVTTEPIANRSAYINGVHIVIALMSDDSNLASFLQFNRLLPWLVDLANRTSDEDMKQQLVSVIIRFAVLKLGEISLPVV